MEDNFGLLFHYKGNSFNNQIEINSLKEVLNGIKLIGKQFDNKIEIYVFPFEEGSFKFGIKDYKDIYKNVIGGVITTGITGLIGFIIFTNGEDYKVNISNSAINGNIIIINNNGEQQEFNQDILPYIGNENIQNGLKKIINPLNNETDKLILKSPGKDETIIKYNNKESFEIKETEALIKIRGFIYEMNVKRKTFKILLPSGDYFMVKVNDNINIGEIQPYLGSNSLELEGKIMKTRSGNIKKMELYSFTEVQPLLINNLK